MIAIALVASNLAKVQSRCCCGAILGTASLYSARVHASGNFGWHHDVVHGTLTTIVDLCEVDDAGAA
jgi:hypothetical protein